MEAYSYRSDPDVPDFDDRTPVIVFDGYCALCSGWVDFLIARDDGIFRFLPAQSPLGEALYEHYGYKSGDYDTNILIENGRARVRSDGTLAMFKRLGWPWRAMGVFRLLPRPIRDWGYERIASNRLRWFGRRDTCRLPTPGEQSRFL
ncbi:MAG: thiol-disulfide oxidoreductase DCC family protein [Litorimonas sp.]